MVVSPPYECYVRLEADDIAEDALRAMASPPLQARLPLPKFGTGKTGT